jgi:hypothetical protein
MVAGIGFRLRTRVSAVHTLAEKGIFFSPYPYRPAPGHNQPSFHWLVVLFLGSKVTRAMMVSIWSCVVPK